MKDLHYKNRTIRMSDDTWDKIKHKHFKSGKSWNLFFRKVFSLGNQKTQEQSKKDLQKAVSNALTNTPANIDVSKLQT